jgi:hypothetical protein
MRWYAAWMNQSKTGKENLASKAEDKSFARPLGIWKDTIESNWINRSENTAGDRLSPHDNQIAAWVKGCQLFE